MNPISKLALAALFTLPLVACGGAPDAADTTTGEQSEGICLNCIRLTDKIAYAEWSGYQIHIHDSVTGSDRVLPVAGRHPSLSPDQSKVAFVQVDGNIYVASAADGSNKVKLTSSGGFDAPAWSPDGTTLVFASTGIAGYAADIYKVQATGGFISTLTANGHVPYPTWYFEPKFLNANTVAFQIGFTGQASFGVVSANALNQSALTYLDVGSGLGNLAVSADGTKIAFTKVNGSCGNQAVVTGTLSGLAVSGLHELVCGADNATRPSIGRGGVVAFQWGPNYGTQRVFTLPWAGGDSKYQSIVSEDTLDMSIQ